MLARVLGHDDRAFRAHVTRTGVEVANRRQGLTARFDAGAVRIRAGGAPIRVALRAIGRGARLRAVGPSAPRVRANRVSYRRAGVIEWYANGPLGLEQGFTLAHPLPGRAADPLTLALRLSGAAGRLDGDRRGLVLTGRDGTRLTYRGLWAADARGRRLRAWLELTGGLLRLRIDDARAAYPVTVDPYFQSARLTASDGTASDGLGFSVAIDGDTIVAGAPFANVNNHADQGAVYVFAKGAGGWSSATETAKLVDDEGVAGDELGFSVAIDGDTIVAGAPDVDVGDQADQGAAYAFVKGQSGWTAATRTKLGFPVGAQGDRLGASVAIAGDTLVAGEPGRSSGKGAVHVFVQSSGWAVTSQTDLTASDGVNGDSLGGSVAIAGDTIVAGAPSHSSGVGDTGAAYVFVKGQSGWGTATQSELTGGAGFLGDSVAIAGDTIVAGAPGEIVANKSTGAVHVFVKGADWSSATGTLLTASGGAAGDAFGTSVAISGDTIVAGSPLANIGTNGDQGAAYRFVKGADGWATASQTQLKAPDGASGDGLGWAVALSSGTIVAGATNDDVGENADQGSARVFEDDSVAPAAPALSTSAPGSPANDNGPRIVGAAEPGATVDIYPNATCAGLRAAQGTAAELASPGLQVSVPDDSTTSFSATATDAAGNVSPCSNALTYVEDSTAPAAPALSGSDPGSPANANAPLIRGAAEPGAIVRLYANASCAGQPAVQGPAAQFASPGIEVAVPDDSTTPFSATATDAAGNLSSCSSAALAYVEDSTSPGTPAINGPSTALPGEATTYTAIVGDGNGSGVDPASVHWRASGGLPDLQGTSATYTFPAPGTFTIGVTATDRAGNGSPEAQATVTVAPPPAVDADGDGALPPGDCDDTNAAIRPGAVDLPANGIDEDCAGGDAIEHVSNVIGAFWGRVRGQGVIVTRLFVRDVRSGQSIEVRCSGPARRGKSYRGYKLGCPKLFRRYRITKAKAVFNLAKPFKKRLLLPGSMVDIRVLKPRAIGRVVKYAIAKKGTPKPVFLCLPPAAPTPARCSE